MEVIKKFFSAILFYLLVSCSEPIEVHLKDFNLEEDVFEFLASEVTSSIRELVGALNRVLAFSKINTKSPTIYECKKF